jgi:hypothetical protein
MNSSGLATGAPTESAVVLASGAGGGEFASVHNALTDSLSTPAVLIRQEDFASIHISLELETGILEVAGYRIRPAVAWARHSSACTMAAQARPTGALSSLGATSWADFIRHITESALAALPGTTPPAPGQLTDATRLGIRTPRTMVTTDIAAGVKYMTTPRVLIKTPDFRLYEPDSRAWQMHWPRIINRDAMPDNQEACGRPIMVQEYVDHVYELRVYYLNGGICAFAVRKPGPSSPWTDPGSVDVTRVDCPPDAAEVVRALCNEWRLSYAAFDLLVTQSGETVFLEANRDGDWLWYERKARWHGVSFMAAVMVRELFAQVTAR